MYNKSLEKTKAQELDPNIRNKNFEEVTLTYTSEQAIEEAKRCLDCKHKPCVGLCPVNVRIPEFITKVANGEFLEAYEIITSTSSLPAVCGRVCPQETQCESVCVRGKKGEPVAIGRLERFVADYCLQNNLISHKKPTTNGKKVAVIGSGPAGLACASELCDLSYDVTVFESLHTCGGVLMYGIPEFRLPKDLVQTEINALKEKGVKFQINSVVGNLYTIQELKEEHGFEAVFLGTGAGLPTFLKIKGENLNTVFCANEFLTRANLMRAYDSSYDTPFYIGDEVAIIGGGNVAMDAARTAKRLGAKNVYIIYRRTRQEMPARLEEIHHALEEGIILKELASPLEVVGEKDGTVTGLVCAQMELGEPDASGRRRPKKVEGADFTLSVSSVIIAIGQTPNPLIKETLPQLDVQPWGGIIVDENGKTNIDGVYAGGDAVSGAATVILAMGAGKVAAKAIDQYLSN